jgi:Sel1 repeat
MASRTRIPLSAPIARIRGRSWCAARLLFLLVAAAMSLRAQEPADPEVDRLTPPAEQGDAAAQLQLGMHYYNGVDPRQRPDYAEALKWFRLAADQGNVDAQDRVGMMYYFGRGVPRDYTEAAHWYLLAAQAGNDHAQRQLIQMYQGGIGVPRDMQESRKWAKLQNQRHPDKTVMLAWGLFGCAFLALLAFAIGLAVLQRHVLTGWPLLAVGLFVHAGGIALVLNSLTTYGFWLVFPHCSHNFLATACTQISDPHTRKIVNQIGDWAMVNLIFRFMAGIGLILDILAAWYLFYLWKLLFRRHAPPGGVPNAQTTPRAGLVAGR